MLKRIKLIQGIGTFSQSRPSGIELSDVTILYGENRYGKSTLCDIFYSLSEDSPECIQNRACIPNDPNKPSKVELQFETATDNVVSLFEDGYWKAKLPSCSKIYVFDQSFIHRNVITGQRLERPNSENMTNFILGESNTALYKTLAEANNSLRDERRLLSNIEKQFTSHSIVNVPTYVTSLLPSRTKEIIEADIITYEASKQGLLLTIQNIDKIKQRSVLGNIGNQVDFEASCTSINTALTLSLQNIHQESLAILETHIAEHVINPATFKGWASQGVTQVKDNCPFCGQELSNDAKGLINAYKNSFNEEFDRYSINIKQRLNNLRQPFSLPSPREALIQQHSTNKQIVELYPEAQFTENQEFVDLVVSLEPRYDNVLNSYNAVLQASQQATCFWLPRLEQKIVAPYDSAEQINFEGLLQTAVAYNKSIYEYWEIIEKINNILNSYKSSLDENHLRNQLTTTQQQLLKDNSALKRIELDPLCNQYKDKQANVTSLNASYEAQKRLLEQSQTDYLNEYFDIINQLFRQLGSSNFEIIKMPNRRGTQIVYDLRIKFKGQDIPVDRINSVFSESDRRALALCIFLAKIISLPPLEKAKVIIVLDDPVTSFDNERIILILNKIDEIKRSIKQLIITTHYKGMAVKAVKKFRRTAKSIKLVQGIDTCNFELVDNDRMMATKHDLAFDTIKAFVSRQTNNDIITTLRPFFEEEIRHRFKKQLLELGKFKSDLSECIVALKNNGDITENIEARLSTIRDTLNTPMHELGENALENTRSLAEDILNIIYHDL